MFSWHVPPCSVFDFGEKKWSLKIPDPATGSYIAGGGGRGAGGAGGAVALARKTFSFSNIVFD